MEDLFFSSNIDVLIVYMCECVTYSEKEVRLVCVFWEGQKVPLILLSFIRVFTKIAKLANKTHTPVGLKLVIVF